MQFDSAVGPWTKSRMITCYMFKSETLEVFTKPTESSQRIHFCNRKFRKSSNYLNYCCSFSTFV